MTGLPLVWEERSNLLDLMMWEGKGNIANPGIITLPKFNNALQCDGRIIHLLVKKRVLMLGQ